MSEWIYADVWETAADLFPEAPALVHGDRPVSWSEFDRRANGLGRLLLAAGVRHQDKVALYLYNCPEYLEVEFACFKCGLVPVNTNYRYADDELVYLWDNADAVAVVFHGTFAERIERHPRPGPERAPLAVGRRRHGACPSWAVPYENAAGTTATPAAPDRCAPVGPEPRRPLHALHRRHDRDAQGRHVAPGRPLRPAQRRRLPPVPRGPGHRRRPGRARGQRAGLDACLPPARSCTAPAASPPSRP